MSTFIGQLIGFGVIVYLVVRYVVPPVRRAMTAQQNAVRQHLEDSASAAKRLAESTTAHTKAVEAAKAEAAKVVAQGKADAERITEQLAAQSLLDAERVLVGGSRQVDLLRTQLTRQLRHELGHESVREAAELVRGYVADPAHQAGTVDRFLDEIDAMAPSVVEVKSPLLATLRSASRAAVLNVTGTYTELAATLDSAQLSLIADELVSVAELFEDQDIIARYLTQPSDDPQPRIQLLDRLVSGKVADATLSVLKAAVTQRWSVSTDLIDCLEHISRQALFDVAEQAGQISEVEDQLFRFSRLLDAQPRLAILLGDYTTPAEGRISLLDNVLSAAAEQANPITVTLLAHTIGLLRHQSASDAVVFLTQVAVARRGDVIAQVSAAADLTPAQRTRVGQILSRIYGHPVTVHLEINPDLLGGLAIAVGDEVIDGTLASRLAAAEAHLPD